MQVLIDRAQHAGAMRCDFSAGDISMIMCGMSATMSVGEWDWHRYLELVLDGLRAGAQSPVTPARPDDYSGRDGDFASGPAVMSRGANQRGG
jgi:hypothetical protein